MATMFSPSLPLATRRPIAKSSVRFNTKSLVTTTDNASSSPEPSLIRRLKFTTRNCITPGRHNARHELHEPLRVVLRLRPIESKSNKADTDKPVIQVLPDHQTAVLRAPVGSQGFKNGERENRFSFSEVFDEKCSQEKLYRASAAPLVESLFDGHNGLIVAYGITNSGKTHTIQGCMTRPGILYRAVDHTFQQLDEIHHGKYDVWVSYLEIYNDKIFDLLLDNVPLNERKALRLISNKKGQVYVHGLREMKVTRSHEARAAVEQGERNRQVAETALNSDSSRSHCVFSLKLVERGHDKDRDGAWAKLSVVDLAGAERSNRTINKSGDRFREASKINTSLMQLGRCLEAVRWNQAHPDAKARPVPFRDSKTTRLFQDYFSGFGRTTMIATANPSSTEYDETVHALKFAALARDVNCVSKTDSGLSLASAATERKLNQQHKRSNRSNDDDDDEDDDENDDDDGNAVLADSGSGGGEDDDDDEKLLDQIYELKKSLVAAERAHANAEQRIRREVIDEMSEHTKQLENMFNKQLCDQKQRIQDVCEKKLKLWKQRVMTDDGRIDESLVSDETTECLQRELDVVHEQMMKLKERVQQAEDEACVTHTRSAAQALDANELIQELQAERTDLVRKLRVKRQELERECGARHTLEALAEERKLAIQHANDIACIQRKSADDTSNANDTLIHHLRERIVALEKNNEKIEDVRVSDAAAHAEHIATLNTCLQRITKQHHDDGEVIDKLVRHTHTIDAELVNALEQQGESAEELCVSMKALQVVNERNMKMQCELDAMRLQLMTSRACIDDMKLCIHTVAVERSEALQREVDMKRVCEDIAVRRADETMMMNDDGEVFVDNTLKEESEGMCEPMSDTSKPPRRSIRQLRNRAVSHCMSLEFQNSRASKKDCIVIAEDNTDDTEYHSSGSSARTNGALKNTQEKVNVMINKKPLDNVVKRTYSAKIRMSVDAKAKLDSITVSAAPLKKNLSASDAVKKTYLKRKHEHRAVALHDEWADLFDDPFHHHDTATTENVEDEKNLGCDNVVLPRKKSRRLSPRQRNDDDDDENTRPIIPSSSSSNTNRKGMSTRPQTRSRRRQRRV